MSSKPTIILVPGSWHVPAHFAPTTAILQSHGYKVVGVHLPTNRNAGPYPGLDEDIGAVTSTILAECAEGNDIVLVMHSYGAIPGSQAAQGLGKVERTKAGEKGGIVRLIYLAALICPIDTSMMDIFEGHKGPYVQFAEDHWYTTDQVASFYHDLPEDEAKKAASLLTNQSMKQAGQKVLYAPWMDIPSVYVRCLDDRALPLFLQEKWSTLPGSKFEIEAIQSGHSLFASKPAETVALIENYAF